MTPDNGIWNYNFMRINFTQNIKYNLILNNPNEFFHEVHRPSHFLNFMKNEDEFQNEVPDREDLFA